MFFEANLPPPVIPEQQQSGLVLSAEQVQGLLGIQVNPITGGNPEGYKPPVMANDLHCVWPVALVGSGAFFLYSKNQSRRANRPRPNIQPIRGQSHQRNGRR